MDTCGRAGGCATWTRPSPAWNIVRYEWVPDEQEEKRRITAQDLVYMAAVIETRGRIQVVEVRGQANPQISLRLQTRVLPVVKRLAALTGSNFTVTPAKEFVHKDRKGCAQHCPEAHIHVVTEIPMIGTWKQGGAAAAIVLSNLLPFMSSEEHDPMARLFRSTIVTVLGIKPTTNRGMFAAREAVRRLGDLGWEIPDELRHHLAE